MSKIYVFAIGGTGSRVLKSLTMLLASGVKTKATEIVPIIIDPDVANGDKTDTVDLMNWYSDIYNTQKHHEDRGIDAFSTQITKLNFPNEYIMPMGDNTNKKFGDYMNFGSLNDANKALVNMLFSEENQEADMTIGFTGNPNIGSVILNQFTKSAEFTTFANSFQPGDKIFIVSSIFGGTGASGFPLLLKNLRHIGGNYPNAAAIQTAQIGAITVLPYFNVEAKKGAKIDSDTFVSKAKAALSYYEHNLNGLNALYYIGDMSRGMNDYNDGGAGQRNKAHFIELASALAILDFVNHSSTQTVYKEFGISEDVEEITLKELGDTTYSNIAKPLTEFTLLSQYLRDHFKNSMSQTWVSSYDGIENNNMFSMLRKFTLAFLNWEAAMGDKCHTRKFSPFILDSNPNDVFGLAKGLSVGSVFGVSAKNWDLFNHFLNKDNCKKQANQCSENIEGRFIAHLLHGTKQVVSKKIKF